MWSFVAGTPSGPQEPRSLPPRALSWNVLLPHALGSFPHLLPIFAQILPFIEASLTILLNSWSTLPTLLKQFSQTSSSLLLIRSAYFLSLRWTVSSGRPGRAPHLFCSLMCPDAGNSACHAVGPRQASVEGVTTAWWRGGAVFPNGLEYSARLFADPRFPVGVRFRSVTSIYSTNTVCHVPSQALGLQRWL